jgi:3-methyladenine DNA glycosylase AlkD
MEKRVYLQTLKELSAGNAEYAAFNKRIVNTEKEVIGVRMPDLRRLSKEIAKGMNGASILAFIGQADKNIYEQVMVCGLLIVYAKISGEEKISLTREYLKHVDSWAHIDCFVDRMKLFDKKLWWDFAIECLESDKEFTARYGVIRLMISFLDEEHLSGVFEAIRCVQNNAYNAYYVQIGMAWLYAEASLIDFMTTIAEADSPGIDPWIRKKAFQKMLESYRISQEQKELIRKIRDSSCKNTK